MVGRFAVAPSLNTGNTAWVDAAAWEAFLQAYPDAHVLQTAAWGDLKAKFGWYVERLIVGEVGAQVLFRPLPLGFTVAYIPKGPVGPVEAWRDLWPKIDALCYRERAVLLKVEPDLWESDPHSAPPSGFRDSRHAIQPRRTLVVSLEGSEHDILARMKQKTRYNIRLAARKGVRVRTWDDIDAFYRLMTETGQRDGFGVHRAAYYRRAYDLFHSRGEAKLLVAEYEGEPLAALMVFARGRRAWYFYGASTDKHRNKMPTYALQWEAMRWAKARGCQEYDLWGVPDENAETLEAEFTQRREGLWGVYRFKRGFGGELRRAPVWDRVYRPLLYSAYLAYLKR